MSDLGAAWFEGERGHLAVHPLCADPQGQHRGETRFARATVVVCFRRYSVCADCCAALTVVDRRGQV